MECGLVFLFGESMPLSPMKWLKMIIAVILRNSSKKGKEQNSCTLVSIISACNILSCFTTSPKVRIPTIYIIVEVDFYVLRIIISNTPAIDIASPC